MHSSIFRAGAVHRLRTLPRYRQDGEWNGLHEGQLDRQNLRGYRHPCSRSSPSVNLTTANLIQFLVVYGTFPSILCCCALHDYLKKKKQARQNRERQERNGPDPIPANAPPLPKPKPTTDPVEEFNKFVAKAVRDQGGNAEDGPGTDPAISGGLRITESSCGRGTPDQERIEAETREQKAKAEAEAFARQQSEQDVASVREVNIEWQRENYQVKAGGWIFGISLLIGYLFAGVLWGWSGIFYLIFLGVCAGPIFLHMLVSLGLGMLMGHWCFRPVELGTAEIEQRVRNLREWREKRSQHTMQIRKEDGPWISLRDAGFRVEWQRVWVKGKHDFAMSVLGWVGLGLLALFGLFILAALYGGGIIYLGKSYAWIVPVSFVIVVASWKPLERAGFFKHPVVQAIWKVICVILGLSFLIGWLYSSGIFE
jgi:hypothetical protein